MRPRHPCQRFGDGERELCWRQYAASVSDTSAYWASIAQLVAVLLLACIIEVRATMRGWRELPRWLRWLQGSMYLTYLGGAAFVLNAAVFGSRPDTVEPPYLRRVAEIAISGMIGILIAMPFVTIAVRTFPEVLARIAIWEPWHRARIAVSARKIARLRGRLARIAGKDGDWDKWLQKARSENESARQILIAARAEALASDLSSEKLAERMAEIDKYEQRLVVHDRELQDDQHGVAVRWRLLEDVERELGELAARNADIRNGLRSYWQALAERLLAIEDLTEPNVPDPPRGSSIGGLRDSSIIGRRSLSPRRISTGRAIRRRQARRVGGVRGGRRISSGD